MVTPTNACQVFTTFLCLETAQVVLFQYLFTVCGVKGTFDLSLSTVVLNGRDRQGS